MKITDEMVEMAARAICDARLWIGSWEQASETERVNFKWEARAALEAVAPLIERAENEIVDAAQTVHDRFANDLAQGYRTKDKEFAVTVLGKALRARHTTTPPSSAPPQQEQSDPAQ